MSTASAGNRFWGVVALALNSALQPAGRICSGTGSPALRLSPLFQVANALSLLHHSIRLSLGIGLPFRAAVGVVAEEAGLYRNNLSAPERRVFFRAGVFVFGALPALIKALAIRGDERVSYWLALGYFVPFVVLEVMERVAVPPSLARLAEVRHRMPAQAEDAIMGFGLVAALFAVVLQADACLYAVTWALMKGRFGAAPSFGQAKLIYTFSPIAAIAGLGSIMICGEPSKDSSGVLTVMLLWFGSMLVVSMNSMDIILVPQRWPELATSVSAIAVFITGTLLHLVVYLRFQRTILSQLFSGEDRHGLKFMEQWIALWTVTCIVLYYSYLYDASGTYKPAWTEWLP